MDTLDAIRHEMGDAVSLASMSGRLSELILAEVKDDLLPLHAFNAVTRRFIRSDANIVNFAATLPSAPLGMGYRFGAKRLNSAFAHVAGAHRGFVGAPHAHAMLEHLGSAEGAFVVAKVGEHIGALSGTFLTGILADLHRNMPPKIKAAPLEYGPEAVHSSYALQLEAVASYAHLAELMSLLREIGNGFALVQLLDAALVEVQVMHAPQAAGVSQTAIDAFGNVAARDGTLRSSLMGAVSQNFRWIGSERTGDGAEEEEKALLEAAWHFADGGTPPSSKPPPLLPPGSEGGGRRVLLPRFLRAVRHAVADVHAPYALAFPPDPSSTRELHGVLGAVLFCFCADVFVPGASSHPTACAAYWEAYGDGVWLGACLLLFCSGQGERFLSGNVLQDVLASHARHRSPGSAPASATSHLLQRSRACLDGIARHLPSLRSS